MRRDCSGYALLCLALKDARRLEGIYFEQPQNLREELRVTRTADKHQRAVLLRPENFHILTRADVLTDESIYLFVYELPLLRTRLFLIKGSRD